jgi:hypothetical protein
LLGGTLLTGGRAQTACELKTPTDTDSVRTCVRPAETGHTNDVSRSNAGKGKVWGGLRRF